MALDGINRSLNKSGYVQIGNRSDVCHLCAMEVTGKNEKDYNEQFAKLKGKHEGKPMMKFRKGGSDVAICLEHIHKIAKENPLTEEQ